MKCSEGDEKMVKIASSIRAGANAYLKQQYSTVAKVFAVVFVILLIIAFASKGQMLSRVTPFAFLTGGIWSMLAGLIGKMCIRDRLHTYRGVRSQLCGSRCGIRRVGRCV